jgi:hypothetical protein
VITRKHAVLLLLARCVLLVPERAVVPRLVNFSGIARDERGNPISGIAGATFAIYKEESGGSPIAFSRIHAPWRLPECTLELANPEAHYFFGCGWTAGSLLGGTIFFSRM